MKTASVAFALVACVALCQIALALAVPLQPESLLFNNQTSFTTAPKGVYVHLFEWKWEDIARECEQFLGPMGYRGIQISPPNEHRRVTSPYLPWWQRYQAVSYILTSRSGNRAQLIDMVNRCKAVGVEIYADIVLNHMTGGGNGYGYAGSYFNADTLTYPEYSGFDFHGCNGCTSSCEIGNYQDRYQVQWCRLVGLRDLKTEDRSYVAPRIAGYMNDLISIGIAGFRLDAAKHMPAADVAYIVSLLRDRTDGKGRPFIFSEVIDLGNEPITGKEYVGIGRVTEFKYGMELGKCFRNVNGQRIAYLREFGEKWGFLPSLQSMAFTDNHDNQRGHGAGGYDFLVTHAMPREYTLANIFMLAWDYGYVQVMSSYYWPRNFQNGVDVNDWMGPPSYSDGTTKTADCNTGEWICEHRWKAIANMVKFRASAEDQPTLNWWDNGNDKISFSRGNRAFLAISSSNGYFQRSYQTGLPSGQYCDIINGDFANGLCTGKIFTVDASGFSTITYGDVNGAVTAVALHVGAKLA